MSKLNILQEKLNGNSSVCFDEAAEGYYQLLFQFYEKKYEGIFKALDIDSKASVSFEIFCFAVRAISKSSSATVSREVFNSFADLYDSSRKCFFVTLNCFAKLCESYKIIRSYERLNFLYNPRESDTADAYDILKENWKILLQRLKLKLLRAGCYDVYAKKMVSLIAQTISDNSQKEENWIRFRLLDSQCQLKFIQ